MPQPESALVTRILKALRARRAWAEKIHGSPFQRAGVPDILLCYRGMFGGVEAKILGNGPSVIQQRTMEEIWAAGGFTCVAYSVEDALALLDEMDRWLD